MTPKIVIRGVFASQHAQEVCKTFTLPQSSLARLIYDWCFRHLLRRQIPESSRVQKRLTQLCSTRGQQDRLFLRRSAWAVLWIIPATSSAAVRSTSFDCYVGRGAVE